MIKKIFAMAAGALASYAAAATAVVWDGENKADMEPAYSFMFKYGTGAAIDTTNVNGTKVLDFTAKAGTTSNGAGYGIGWKQSCDANWNCTDVAVSLSAYKGVCLTYKAEMPFRVDFKQSTITDDNYYGMELAASSVFKKQFIAFSELTQGWKSKTAVAWNASKQLGVQFGFKNTHATATSNSNEVMLQSFILADECVTFAPQLTAAFAANNGGEIAIAEGATHTIDMSEVFTDEDGDDLVVTVKINGESVILVDSTKYNQNSAIKFTTVPNPKENAEVVITATDPTKKSATFSFTFLTEDVPNAPVAKDCAFEIPEDSSYKSGLTAKTNNLKFMGSDADGDKINLVIVDEPEHGTFELNASTGVFIYTPDKDFNGMDSFTYKFVEVANEESESNLGTCVITVTPVNDAPVIKVVAETFEDESGDEHTFGDTLTVDEDFETFSVFVPSANITVTDVDGEDDIVINAKSSGVVKAAYAAVEGYYGIEVSAIKDANGLATVSLVAGDHKITKATVICYVKVNPVADAPVGKEDSYTVVQDSLNKITAKKGVLANDVNPDSIEISAILVVEPENGGTVELAEDGSFTYMSAEGYEGEDAFAYAIVYGSDTTEMIVVTLDVVYKNHAPEIVEGVADTVGNKLAKLTEDFTTPKKYTAAELRSWFTDDTDKPADLKFTVRSDDSLTNPSISTAGILQVAAVKNACGDAEVILTAIDKQGASTDLVIPASIACVNDKPTLTTLVDTFYIEGSNWSGVYDLTKVVSDPDGDTLTYTITDNIAFRRDMSFELDGDSLRLAVLEDSELNEGEVRTLTVKAADAATYVTFKIQLVVGKAPADSGEAIAPVMAAAKLNWQGAIQATRGMATMMDMQGRILWTRRLPVSESEVRAAAASVQGRKVLRVNSQTYTIK